MKKIEIIIKGSSEDKQTALLSMLQSASQSEISEVFNSLSGEDRAKILSMALQTFGGGIIRESLDFVNVNKLVDFAQAVHGRLYNKIPGITRKPYYTRNRD